MVTRLNQRVELFHNQTEPAGNWLIFQLQGTASNRGGLGGVVRVRLSSGRILTRLVRSAVGFGGSSDARVHVGLGDETAIRSIEVIWPEGKRRQIEPPPVNRILRITQDGR